MWRGPLCFNLGTKGALYKFSLPLGSVLPLKALLREQRLPPALRTSAGDSCAMELLKPRRDTKKKTQKTPHQNQNPAVPTERKISRDNLLGVAVTATLSFLDTMFLLTLENFPLECAINQQRRRQQQQLWRRRRSSEKGHSFFHLLEQNKRGEGGRAGGSAASGALLQAGPPGDGC